MTAAAREYPPLREIKGHTDTVFSVVVTPDEQQVISSSVDNTVRVWSLASGEEIRQLKTPDGTDVVSLAITPDGHYIVGVCDSADDEDISMCVWDAYSGEQTPRLFGYTQYVMALVAVPDRQHVIIGGCDRAVRVWSLENDRELLCFRGHEESVQALAVYQNMVVSGCRRGRVCVWALDDGRELQRFVEPHHRVRSVTTAGNGQYVVASYWHFMLDTGMICVWSVASGQMMRYLTGYEGRVETLATLPDGQHIVGGDDRAVRVWSLDSGAVLYSFSPSGFPTVVMPKVAVSHSGKYIIDHEFLDTNIRVHSPLQYTQHGLRDEYSALQQVADKINDIDSLVSLMLRGVLMQDTALRIRIVEKKLAAL